MDLFISEESVSLSCIDKENLEDTLLLLDRGYPSYWLMYMLIRKEVHFLMRVQKNANQSVISFINSHEQDVIVDVSILEIGRQA